ncbi:MAG TPA: SRPBCC family protein [Puia sp.]|nr:SRPBCC family protein [Puia sp.]
MPTIHLTTFVAAPADRVFDLSRSVELHKKSMAKNEEKVVSGVSSGLMELHETVTWQAKHLFKNRFLKSKITAMQKPVSFIDEMVKGDFKSMKHEHHFKQIENGTLMIDVLYFESPYGSIGKLTNKVFLTSYLRKLLEQRNQVIKQYAETEKWKFILTR